MEDQDFAWMDAPAADDDAKTTPGIVSFPTESSREAARALYGENMHFVGESWGLDREERSKLIDSIPPPTADEKEEAAQQTALARLQTYQGAYASLLSVLHGFSDVAVQAAEAAVRHVAVSIRKSAQRDTHGHPLLTRPVKFSFYNVHTSASCFEVYAKCVVRVQDPRPEVPFYVEHANGSLAPPCAYAAGTTWALVFKEQIQAVATLAVSSLCGAHSGVEARVTVLLPKEFPAGMDAHYTLQVTLMRLPVENFPALAGFQGACTRLEVQRQKEGSVTALGFEGSVEVDL